MFVRKILVILTYKTFSSIDFFVVLRCQISKSTTWKSQKMFLKIQNTFVHFYEYIILNEILPFPPRHDQSEKSSWLPKSTRLGMVLKKNDRLFHSPELTDWLFTLRLQPKYEVNLINFQAEWMSFLPDWWNR